MMTRGLFVSQCTEMRVYRGPADMTLHSVGVQNSVMVP